MTSDLTGTKAFTEGAADDSVQSQARASLIDRGPGVTSVDFSGAGGMLYLNLQRAAEAAPVWSYYPARRDAYLRRLWKREPGMASAVYSLSARIKALQYEFDGGRNQKKYYQDLAGAANFGKGLPHLVSKTVTDLLTQDNGAFWELIGPGDPNGPLVGPVRGVAHLDSAQCWRTFDPEYPVVYHNPQMGKWHRLHWTRVVAMSSLPQPNELARDIGFCAVSRVLDIVQTMRAIHTYRHEKITGTQPAIGYGNGFTVKNLDLAVQATKNKAESEGLVVWNGIPIMLNPDAQARVSLDFLSIKGLPDGFDYADEQTFYIYALAFGFGVDAREFWPATTSGATKADATIQHLKAQGKGIGDLIQTIEWAWNWRILPEGCTFHYDFTDDEQDKMTAEIRQAKVNTLAQIKSAGGMNAKQFELHLVAEGILDPDLMAQGANAPDPVTPTDSQNLPPGTTPDLTELEDVQPADETGGMKDYATVRADFIDALTDLFSARDDLTRRQLAASLRSTLRTAGLKAFQEGLAAGGALPESLSQAELQAFRDWQTEQSAYVTNLGSALYVDEVALNDARAKAELWAHNSLDSIKFTGEKMAAPLKRKKWVLHLRKSTKEPCADCLRLNGQVHTVRDWDAAGITPYNGATKCAQGCGCGLEDTDEPISGSF